jgi:cytochrome c5
VKHTTVALIFSTVISLLSLLGGGVFAGTVEEAVSERIKPVGSLCMIGNDCAAGAQPVARTLVSEKRTGAEVYGKKCTICHTAGAGGAPIVDTNDASATAWAPRINKGIGTLFANSIGGINGMPAQGLCNDCSDDEIKATVCYMLNTAIPASKITNEIKNTCATIENSM